MLDDQIVYISDAVFANDLATKYSTERYLFKLFNRPINWRSTKQKTITTSNTETELLALSYTAKDMIWWKRFFSGIKQLNINKYFAILYNNTQTIRLITAETPQINIKLKHIDIQGH